MNNDKAKLVDPVEGQSQSQELKEFEEAVDIGGLDLSDFSVPEQKYTQKVHPFDGYPQQMKEIVIGSKIQTKHEIGPHKGKNLKEPKTVPLKQSVNATHLVAMNPTEHIHQDPSGRGHQLKKSRKIVNLKTFHNRVVVNTDNKRNTDVVFDRELFLKNGKKMQYAVVDNHGARAQLIFFYDPAKKKVQVDKRYMLLDKGQMARLRKTFDQWNYQLMKAERLSQQHDDAEESTAQDKG